MGKHQLYPKYKDSGIDWIGEVPEFWLLKRLKFSAYLVNQKIDAESSTLPYMGLEHIQSWTGERIKDSNASSEGIGSHFLPNDVLFGKLRPYLAKVHLAKHEGLASTEALVLRSRDSIFPPFLRYYSVSRDFIHIVDSSTFGTKMPRASWDFIGNLAILVPSLPEQQTIATFLDHKTAQIDALIAKKEALLEKLAEKRTALISQAVTKGLDPTVPMKDSGIKWLGEIPAHWGIAKLGYFASIGNGSTPKRDKAEYWSRKDFPWLNSSKINEEIIVEAEQHISKQALEECHLPVVPAGSVLIAITGEGQTRGRSALLSFEATISQHLASIQPISEVMGAIYLRRYLQAAYQWLRNESNGAGSTRAALTCDFLKKINILLPPLNEQVCIINFLDSKLEIDHSLASATQISLKKLKEYRTALITNAVTGKIDVRNVKLPQPTPTELLATLPDIEEEFPDVDAGLLPLDEISI
ncbi:Type-1 restriction enzyme EcoKI specificity protein [Acaryochloris thomasi RCC1774]|uniref:Type-1 restriction enzyme EcoKI specificity protein n=1 Tax=Acaryochloris thomasi RCC1774 TaxID=1764569 RepID=A0A2W1JZ39_9CYAN|nr:restriction endonuclease subunit S [Acaryochloris thomasi]PZD73751.1 Type-1 restriction enzyme EcoKI specificity protein [Acaryochloris thomasi RCC1774]